MRSLWTPEHLKKTDALTPVALQTLQHVALADVQMELALTAAGVLMEVRASQVAGTKI